MISNKVYAVVIVNDVISVCALVVLYLHSLKMMWPALIFALSRNARVIGRIETLIDSIMIMNEFNHVGVPWGRNVAILALELFVILDLIKHTHIGTLRDKAKIMWDDKLKVYGINLIKLINSSKVNSAVTRFDNPFI